MTWKRFVSFLVREYCDSQGSRTFTLPDLYAALADDLAKFAPNNQHREAKLRQTLQFLRDDGLLTFVDNHGAYTLRGVELLRDEVTDPQLILASATVEEHEREYLKEVNARYRGWVKVARLTYGDYCLIPGCQNSFLLPNGERYVEVHHIDPLCDGGEDAIWNLSVVCAHHHRVAHFADAATRQQIRAVLIERTQRRLVRAA